MSTFIELLIIVLFFNIIIMAASLSHTLKAITTAWERNEHFNYGKGSNIWTLLNPNIGVTIVFVTFGLNILLFKKFGYELTINIFNIKDFLSIFLILVVNYLIIHIAPNKTTYNGYTLICILCTIMITIVLFIGNVLTFLKAYPNV